MTKAFGKLSSLLLGATLAVSVANAGGGELEKIMKERGLCVFIAI